MNANTSRRGFTLVEALVVVGILALGLSLLLPTLGHSRAKARQIRCLSNLRQMASAAHAYATASRGRLPLSYWHADDATLAWDYTRVLEAPGKWRVVPGMLWMGAEAGDVHQCPDFDGRSNWADDPFTGYNYNTSYLGGGQHEKDAQNRPAPEPARLTWVSDPAGTAMFGDSEYAAGANKFMRAPRHGGRDGASATRAAGSQGYRHVGATNVAFVDGHATAWEDRFTLYDIGPAANPVERDLQSDRIGFLSEDNSLYDLGRRDR